MEDPEALGRDRYRSMTQGQREEAVRILEQQSQCKSVSDFDRTFAAGWLDEFKKHGFDFLLLSG
jgi:hypothetical protein